MQIKLFYNDGVTKDATIQATGLTAPSVISHQGKFFIKNSYAAALTVDRPAKFISYQQCRGEFLNNIEVARGTETEHDL